MLMSETGLTEAPAILPGARFSNAFVAVSRHLLDANAVMERAFVAPAGWTGGLMRLRDGLVRPLGLKTREHAKSEHDAGSGTWFRVVERTSRRVVLGTDDWHLDFRVILDADPLAGEGTRISCTTLVEPHNLFGWLYLGVVFPFHKLIVADIMRRAAR